MNVETLAENAKLASITIQVPTPDGTMFVTITEDKNGAPNAVFIHIGKAGASVSTWAQALARMVSLALDNGAKLEDVMTELSNHTTDRVRVTNDGELVRSGIDGVWVALMKYKRAKFDEVRKTLGNVDEHRGPRLGR
jgi:hypothetical protein